MVVLPLRKRSAPMTLTLSHPWTSERGNENDALARCSRWAGPSSYGPLLFATRHGLLPSLISTRDTAPASDRRLPPGAAHPCVLDSLGHPTAAARSGRRSISKLSAQSLTLSRDCGCLIDPNSPEGISRNILDHAAPGHESILVDIASSSQPRTLAASGIPSFE